MKKSTHTTITLIFFSIVILVVVFAIRFFRQIDETAKADFSRTDLTFQDNIPNDYMQVIKAYTGDSLKTSAVTKTMAPVASFRSNDKELIMFKLPTKSDKKMVDVIKCDSINAPDTDGQRFWEFSDEHFVDDPTKGYSLCFGVYSPHTTSTIYLTLIGKNNQKVVRNDSTLIYTSNLVNCSLSYQSYKDSLAMHLRHDERLNSYIPVHLNFLKRNGFFYLVIQIEK